MNKLILFFLLLVIFAGCFWDSSFSKHVIGPYYLGVDYGTNQLCLQWRERPKSDGTEKIPSKILEIGWDDKFIVAKQVAVGDPTATKDIMNYYIIVTATDSVSCYDCPIGPLEEKDYHERRQRLKIPDHLKFHWKIENFDVVDINN